MGIGIVNTPKKAEDLNINISIANTKKLHKLGIAKPRYRHKSDIIDTANANKAIAIIIWFLIFLNLFIFCQ